MLLVLIIFVIVIFGQRNITLNCTKCIENVKETNIDLNQHKRNEKKPKILT